MTDQPNNGAVANEEENAPQFSLQRIYVRDLSFEAPKSPAIFRQDGPRLSASTSTPVRSRWKAISTKWC